MTMKTLLMGEHTELPVVLRHLLKLRHGQLIFKGLWNGTVGENSDLQAVIQVHDTRLMDLLFRNGVLGQQKALFVVTGAVKIWST